MGNRMHVQIRHEIEYGSEGFNWQMNGMERLLGDAGCSVGGELNEDACGDWEIEEEEFRNAVGRIRRMREEKIAGYFDKDYAGSNLKELKEHVTALLQDFLDNGDHHDGYYHFSWF